VAVILQKEYLTEKYDAKSMAPFLKYEDDDYLGYEFDDVSEYQEILDR
jgi:hypothetical protein